jgi:hypothetical protein
MVVSQGLLDLVITPDYYQFKATETKQSSLPALKMYRPNFCSDCGAKIIRLHWHPWTSRRFCDSCAKRLRRERMKPPLVVGVMIFGIGLLTGRAIRPAPPPLVIQRSANSPLFNAVSANGSRSSESANKEQAPALEEATYICGARTKKGTPCSRRVHQPGRCWQHKGMPAMVAPDKPVVK